MADTAIVNAAIAAAPKDYVISPGVEFRLKAVRAVLDGTAAAGSWLPCLELVAPSGAVMWAAVPDEAVAVGGSADVSWFPEADEDVATATANFGASILALGPWAFWKLNEAAGSTLAADSSGHGRTLTTADGGGTLAFGQPGLVPSSTDSAAGITFNAATNVYPLEGLAAQAFTASAVTMVAWIKPVATTGHEQTICQFGRLDTEETWWFLVNSTGQPEFRWLDAGSIFQILTFGVATADGNPHMLAVVADGANASCYLDGVLFQTQAMPTPLVTPATHVPYIGQGPGGAGSRMYNGALGPVAIFDKALTASQIAALYNNGSGGSGGSGAVASVSAGDSSIAIGGTATDPTVAVAPSGVAPATYGDATHVPQVAIDSHGRVTSAANVAVSGGSSPLTTKGDIYGHSATDARIPVGSDGQVLVADSSQALGVKWGAGGAAGSSLVTVFHLQLGVNAASIDTGANAIPATYRHLLVLAKLRTTNAVVHDGASFTLNGITSGVYQRGTIEWQGTALTSATTFNGTNFALNCPGATTGSRWEFVELTFIDYADTGSGTKVANGFGNMFGGTGASSMRLSLVHLSWDQSAAINQFTFSPSSGNFAVGSSLTIYAYT